MQNIKIGQLLVDGGYLTDEQLTLALNAQKDSGGKKLGDLLVEMELISERELMGALQKRLNVPIIELQTQQISIEAVKLVPEESARKYQLIPIKTKDGILTVATNNPLDFYAFEDIQMMTGMEVVSVLATKKDIDIAIQKYYTQYRLNSAIEEANQEFDLEALQDLRGEDYNEMLGRVENAPVVRLVNSILTQAYRMRASDIHIEPRRDDVRVRFRVDGDLLEAMLLNSTVHISLVTRLKIMGGIDIAERRIPQDGRFSTEIDGRLVNIRMSTLPTSFGEKVVIRLLGDNVVSVQKLTELGMNSHNLEMLTRLIKCPNGIILVTGPTGSGKSTTIYSILNEICSPATNIVTIEDPVEKVVPNLNQVQINVKAGLTFASGLRSILRQDPDVIMVGEIRDGETASIAARAAITGHLVFSTVHTNDAVSTFLRIIDMGVEPYIVASSVIGVVSQRLIKLTCPHCKKKAEPTPAQLAFWEGEQPDSFYRGEGCVRCNFTGYMGRTAIHEVIPMSADLNEMVLRHASSLEMRECARKNGRRFLKDNLMELVRAGDTSLEELMRVTYSLDL